jgi:hypothetical protein
LDKPLHVIYKVSKLAYRIGVILITNERVKKNIFTMSDAAVINNSEWLWVISRHYVGMAFRPTVPIT